MKIILSIQCILLLAMPVTPAQVTHMEDPGKSYLSLGYSSDAFSSVDIGYSRKPAFIMQNNAQLYARLSIPLFLSIRDKSLDSWEVDLGLNSGILGSGKIGVIADIRFFIIHHKNILGTFVPLGLDMSLTPAYNFLKGYMGVQFKWNQAIATYIKHSEYVDNTFSGLTTKDNTIYNIHPEDGWYGFTGSHFGIGLEGGRSIGSRYFINGDLGIIKFSSPYTGMFDAMMMGQVPFYLDLRLFYKLQ